MTLDNTSASFATLGPRTALRKLHTVLLSGSVGLVGLVGCGVDEPSYSSTAQLATVATYTTGGGCSTAVVLGLSKQISDEVGCIDATSLVPFEASATLTLSSNAVLPYLEKTAAAGLVAASQEGSIQVNSAFRTIAQQYLLYRWYQAGTCGITAAATVGHSNHEGGRAVDLANYSSRISIMSRHGWAHDVAGDPVHFDHTASVDNRGLDTKAFQRLWNRNNPSDTISEDGAYGPQTETRLKKSPATGFALGPSCGTRANQANVVSIDGPDRVEPQQKLMYAITIANTGTAEWPASTQLVTASGDPSAIYDADTWVSPTEFGTLGAVVPAGATTVVQMTVESPAATEETPVFQQMLLTEGGQTFGTINLAFTVVPGMDPTMTPSTDGGDGTDAPAMSGGCSAGGSAGWLLALPALALLRRRRR